jgi:hypothetical protein
MNKLTVPNQAQVAAIHRDEGDTAFSLGLQMLLEGRNNFARYFLKKSAARGYFPATKTLEVWRDWLGE